MIGSGSSSSSSSVNHGHKNNSNNQRLKASDETLPMSNNTNNHHNEGTETDVEEEEELFPFSTIPSSTASGKVHHDLHTSSTIPALARSMISQNGASGGDSSTTCASSSSTTGSHISDCSSSCGGGGGGVVSESQPPVSIASLSPIMSDMVAAMAVSLPQQPQPQQQYSPDVPPQHPTSQPQQSLCHNHYPDSSVLMLDSQYLDAAASMMLFGTESITAGSASVFTSSLSLLNVNSNQTFLNSLQLPPPSHPITTTPTQHQHSIPVTPEHANLLVTNHDFSMLLERADNNNQPQKKQEALPQPSVRDVTKLPSDDDANNSFKTKNRDDETSTSCGSSIVILEAMEHPSQIMHHHHYDNNNRHHDHRRLLSRSRSAAAVNMSHSMHERGLAELVGASVHIISKDTFTVSIDVHATVATARNAGTDGVVVDPLNSTMMNRTDTLQQQQRQQIEMKENILDIIGNPDLLRLWYDAIPCTSQQQQSLIIISSSEGARNAIHRTQEQNATREYEGEWIEAICPKGFVVPPASQSKSAQASSSSTSSTRLLSSIGRIFINIGASVAGIIGCPSNSGTVSMFVERSIGQVSITLNSFPGNIQVCHRIKVMAIANGGGKIRIEDTVRLRYNDERLSSDSIFSCCDAIWECFLPSLDDYVDQVLSSMARLRFLIENGEEGSHSDDARYKSGVNDGTPCDETLLLSTWMGTPQLSSNNTNTNPLLTRLL